ncbi:hypothetical protein T484DRAFT_2617393 [Baffinella frigidus]|nr:hypothetical protein T484DRAFT_2617393 [Cryptophyta sp. CCMP2293]
MLPPSENGGGGGKGWRDDVLCDEKERVNARVAALHQEIHGPPGQQGVQSQAMYLDGAEMRTTKTLLAWDWAPENLHIPNHSREDHRAIQRKAAREYAGLHAYLQSSTAFLAGAAGQPWAAGIRGEHRGHGPFSLVYLDYTSVEQWPLDVELLLREKLFVPGAVFAVTCPARAPHVKPGKDAHVSGEGARKVTVGGREVILAQDLATVGARCGLELGQAKLETTLRAYPGIPKP